MSDQPPAEPRTPQTGVAPPTSDRLRELYAELQHVGLLTDVRLTLPRSGRVSTIMQPADTDLLLDLVEGDPEQNLPYWAELWPSGIALADAILQQPALVRGKRVLEIGSGIGITAIAALQAGARLTVADYAPAALSLCRLNTRWNAGQEPETLQLNWRRPGQALFDLAGAGFPVVLAADVLYEARDIAPLLALIDRLVAPDGLLWLAEPSRPVADRFLDAARQTGWHGSSETHPGPWPEPKDKRIVVTVHTLRRA